MNTGEYLVGIIPFLDGFVYTKDNGPIIEVQLLYNIFMETIEDDEDGGSSIQIELQEWNPFSDDMIHFLNAKDIIDINEPNKIIADTYAQMINKVAKELTKNTPPSNTDINQDDNLLNELDTSKYSEPYWKVKQY